MKISIGKEIETMRGETSIHKKNKYPNTRKATKVVRIYKVPNAVNIPSINKELKQKIQVKTQGERRFDKRYKFYRLNAKERLAKMLFSRNIKPGMLGLGIASKKTFLSYSTQFVLLLIRLVPENVVLVTIDMCRISPITSDWIYGIM